MRTRRLYQILLRCSLACLLCLPLTLMAQTTKTTEYFSLTVPEGYELTSSEPVEDFKLFRVQRGEHTILLVYVGNAPSYHVPLSQTKTDQIARFKAGQVELMSVWSNGKLERRELLVRLRHSGWPQYLHATTGTPIDIADQVMSSLQIKPGSTE